MLELMDKKIFTILRAKICVISDLWKCHHCHLVKISDDPVSVQLNFEPTKRMATSKYRLQERQNLCSVCGATENFMRRLIVPLEYRR